MHETTNFREPNNSVLLKQSEGYGLVSRQAAFCRSISDTFLPNARHIISVATPLHHMKRLSLADKFELFPSPL